MMRKRMYFLPGAVIIFILYFTIFGERGLLHIYRLKREKVDIAKKVEAMKGENDRWLREREALRTARRYLESIARKDFGLVRPNEVIYQFPGAKPAAPPAPAAPPQASAASAPSPQPH